MEVTDALGHKAVSAPFEGVVEQPALPEPVTVEVLAVEDTFVSSWAPDANYGSIRTFSVRNTGEMAGLVKFDTSGIPAGATVLEAKLILYPTYRTNGNVLSLEARPVLAGWSEDGVTWNAAPSAGDLPDATAEVTAIDQEIELDITARVQQWVDDMSSNHGVSLVGNGSKSVEVQFIANEFYHEFAGPAYPLLVITFQ